jgi:phage baseplate assembly protein W
MCGVTEWLVGESSMVEADPAPEKLVGRREQIAQAIVTLLRTPQGTVATQPTAGVNYIDTEGCPPDGLGPATVEASVHNALLQGEPRIELEAVTAHFDGDVLTDIRVAYRDREDASQHEVTVTYRE